MTISRTRPGFTLIELLVVIAIIATLMGLLIPSVSFVKAQAKKTKTRQFLAQVEAALNSYKNVNGVFPENIDGDPATPMSTTTSSAPARRARTLTAAMPFPNAASIWPVTALG